MGLELASGFYSELELFGGSINAKIVREHVYDT